MDIPCLSNGRGPGRPGLMEGTTRKIRLMEVIDFIEPNFKFLKKAGWLRHQTIVPFR
jgi:hypothetical protein